MLSRACSALLFASAVVGCGGGNDVEPRVIPGGGIGDPGIDGEVNVYVIDDDTDEPIEGAEVHVGDASGETDADGLFVMGGVSGPQTITVIADDYTAATWFGADGANVTVPLSLADPGEPDVPSATLTGTIDGWATMEPPTGDFLVAFVGYSATNLDEDPANEIEQPQGDGNLCFKAGGADTPCSWSLLTRTGEQVVYALIGHATPDAGGGDPTIVFTDFAFLSGVDVDDGDDQSGLTLEIVDRDDLETPDVTLPSAPSGTDTVNALARLDLGAEGRLQLPLTGGFIAPVPKASLFDGASYELIGVANNDTVADPDADADAASYRINRGLDTLDGATLGTLLPLPGELSTDGTDFTFEAVEGASIQIVGVADADDVGVWSAVILDDTLEVRRPDIVELADGPLTFTAQALEIPNLDLQEFAIDDLTDTIKRASAAGVEFAD